MPWLEERTLTLFVRDTEVRRYEPGVRERGVDVERPSGPLMGSADTDTDPDRALTLKAPVIHGHLIRQHFLQRPRVSLVFSHLLKEPSVNRRRLARALFTRVPRDAQTGTRIRTRVRKRPSSSSSPSALPTFESPATRLSNPGGGVGVRV